MTVVLFKYIEDVRKRIRILFEKTSNDCVYLRLPLLNFHFMQGTFNDNIIEAEETDSDETDNEWCSFASKGTNYTIISS